MVELLLATLFSLLVGFALGYVWRRRFSESTIGSAEAEAERLRDEGRKDAEILRRDAKLAAQEETQRIIQRAEQDARE